MSDAFSRRCARSSRHSACRPSAPPRMCGRFTRNSAESHAFGGAARAPRFARHGAVSNPRRTTRTAPSSTLSRPERGVMAPVVFSNRVVNAMSWATDAPGGFTPADGELLRDLVPAFVPVLEATALRRIYGELLATYVGRDPGARIMAGAVQRGDVRRLKAALLLADMRGFSRLTDLLPEERIVELLNAFFDLIVPGVIARGGDVLKYVGDAVIAIFAVPGDDPAPSCEMALAAAQTALAALDAAPPEIRQHVSIDIALHYGDAAYGNIGSGNRLDFTAIGRDVNILSRLELLCKEVGRPLLMTDDFAVEVAEPVIEIGHFELRGFRRSKAVYALCQQGEQPCSPELLSLHRDARKRSPWR